MGEIINLNKVRKARKQAQSEKEAAQNRSLHRLSKQGREKAELLIKQAKQKLDGTKIED